jgi:hypothetical protein
LLLTDGDIDAEYVGIPLIEDRIHSDGGLPRLPVPNDELPLTPANGDHGVDTFEAGLKRLLNRLPLDNVRCPPLDEPIFLHGDGALPVDGLTNGVNDPSDKGISHGYREDLARSLDGVALLDFSEFSQDHGPDVILLQIEGHAKDVVRKLEHLRRHAIGKSLDSGDPIARLDDFAHLLHVDGDLIRLDLLL